MIFIKEMNGLQIMDPNLYGPPRSVKVFHSKWRLTINGHLYNHQPYQLPGLVHLQKKNWKDPACYQWVNPRTKSPFSSSQTVSHDQRVIDPPQLVRGLIGSLRNLNWSHMIYCLMGWLSLPYDPNTKGWCRKWIIQRMGVNLMAK